LADASTLSSRLSAARAVTNTQTGGAAPAPTNGASTSSAPAASTGSPAADASKPTGTAPADAKETPAVDADKGTSDDTKADGGDKPQTPEELKKHFVAIDRREKKLKRQRKEWEADKKAKESEFTKAREELVQENNRISALQRHVEQKHAWVAKGQQAWDNDDKVGFAKAIEKMAKGASLAAITQWLAGATDKPAGAAKAEPSEEEQGWRREKAEWERKQAEERAKAEGSKKETASAEKRDQAKGRIAVAFARHPFLANPDDPQKPDPDALQEAFERWEGAMKHRRPGQTAREVAKEVLDQLHAREVRRLKRLGIEPKTAAPANGKGAAKGTEGRKQGERLPEPPPTNRGVKPPSLDETRANRIAAARRMTEQQRRGVV